MGAGAIGCYLGGRLAAAGHTVTFIGRPRVIATLRLHGLTVTDLDGFKAHVPGEQLRLADRLDASLFAQTSNLLLCVKDALQSSGEAVVVRIGMGYTALS